MTILRLLLSGAAALAVMAGGAAPAAARKPAPTTAADGAIPRAADGHPDFTGIWETLSEADYDLEAHAGRIDAPPGPGVVEGGDIPYLPAALEHRSKNFVARAKEDPRLRCYVLGVPRGVYYPAPFQILQREADLTLVHQFGNQVRVIHKDGSLHPEEKDKELWLGDNRAHWEGDVLVNDVTDVNDETWLDRAGNYHSEKLHVVERWQFVDKDTIRYRATLDDPKVYSRPWTVEVLLNRRREANFRLIEDYCYTLEYADFYPHRSGQ